MDEAKVREIIQDELQYLIKNDKYVFQKLVQIMDGRNIQLGRTTGTQIGTASDQKLGFFGDTPVVQQSAISNPAGGGDEAVDTPARNAINSILTALRNLGLIDT